MIISKKFIDILLVMDYKVKIPVNPMIFAIKKEKNGYLITL